MKAFGYKTGWYGAATALLAAVLFGASTPLAKAISPHVDPVLMAGLLYLSSGMGLGAYALLRARHKASWGDTGRLKTNKTSRKRESWFDISMSHGNVNIFLLECSGFTRM